MNANGLIKSLTSYNAGNLYASGFYYVAQWNGTSQSNLGNMKSLPVTIYVDSSGKLYSVVSQTINETTTYIVVDI